MANDEAKNRRTIIVTCVAAPVAILLSLGLAATSLHRMQDARNDALTAAQQSAQLAYGTYGSALASSKLTVSELLQEYANTDRTPAVVTDPKTSVDTLKDNAKANNLNPDAIIADESGEWVYVIQPGDTLSALSKAFGYSVDELAQRNCIRDVNRIYANSALRVPQSDKVANNAR